MKISTRGRYALEALLDLALHAGMETEQLSRVARRRGLSENYLEQIFMVLKEHGIVESTRGARGGYRLVKAPECITAGEVLRALEGPLAPVACVTSDPSRPACSRMGKCVTRALWIRIMEGLDEVTDTVTLRDLAEFALSQPAQQQGGVGLEEGAGQYEI
ncbi:MAG TPA: AsnC family transcriptional regulator [Clostridiales bacterium]|nr:AsnC family transcriptional regulator [Clostridiales bacterium]